ncbi:MAG: tetratricopeptide repeat protein, partial [Candidatus Acidiferrales bacterium]
LRRDTESGQRSSSALIAPARPRRDVRVAIAAAAIVGLLAVLGWLVWSRTAARPAVSEEINIRSLAVLPLQNLSGDADQEYLADGLTEALISDLAQLHGLRVVSRTSAMQYKTRRKALPEIARELNVDAVVEGSVVRVGDRIRVSAQLVHALADRHLWAQTYDRQFTDILTLQSEVAQAIAAQIRLSLTEQERGRLQRRGPVNAEAHEAYLRGRRALQRFTPESLRQGLEYFRRATELDPNFAEAYSGIADAHTQLGVLNMVPPQQAFPEALSAAGKALALDDTLSEPHVSLGYAEFLYGWKFEEAHGHFQQALQLNPNSPEARRGHSLYLAAMGRADQAVAEAERAVSLDPLSPYFQTNLIYVLVLAGRHNDAVAAGEKAVSLDAAHLGAHLLLGLAYESAGRYDEAIAEFDKTAELSPIAPAMTNRVRSLALAGKTAEARAELKKLQPMSEGADNPVAMAQIHAALGENDRALQWLAQAEKQRQGGLVYLHAHPRFAPLRSDPRYAQFTQRIGLPAPVKGVAAGRQ